MHNAPNLKELMGKEFDPKLVLLTEIVNAKLKSVDAGYALAGMIVSRALGNTGLLPPQGEKDVANYTVYLARTLGKAMSDDLTFLINSYGEQNDKTAELPLVS